MGMLTGEYMKLLIALLMMVNVAFANSITLDAENTVSLRDAFDSGSVANVINKLQELHADLPEHREINLYLNSPGGSIIAGNELIKFINSLGREVNVICDFCASMGFQTFQGINGKRYITKFGVLMSHKAYGGFRGEFPGQVQNRLDFWLKRVAKMDDIVVARTNGKQTLKSYQALYENEYWCNDTDCVEAGFADAVADVKCSKSLSGTTSQIVRSYFGTYEIFVSKCPLITGIIKYRKVDRDGDPLGPFITNKTNIRDLILGGRSIQELNAIDFNK